MKPIEFTLATQSGAVLAGEGGWGRLLGLPYHLGELAQQGGGGAAMGPSQAEQKQSRALAGVNQLTCRGVVPKGFTTRLIAALGASASALRTLCPILGLGPMWEALYIFKPRNYSL